MAQSARGGLDFGRAKPADPSARARARAILKNAPPVFSRGKVSDKNSGICCSCVPNGQIWVGSFPNFLKIVWKILNKFWSPGEVRRKSGGSQEEVKRKSRGSQEEVKRKSRGPLVQKCIFGRNFSWRPISPLGSSGRPRLQNCRGRRFLRQPVQYAAGMLRVC